MEAPIIQEAAVIATPSATSRLLLILSSAHSSIMPSLPPLFTAKHCFSQHSPVLSISYRPETYSHPSGTGEHAAQSRQGEVWDTSGHASLSARQQFQAPVTQTAFELSTPQKAILAVSFFIPGVAHLAFGQTKKGAVLLVAIFLTLGIIYLAWACFWHWAPGCCYPTQDADWGYPITVSSVTADCA